MENNYPGYLKGQFIMSMPGLKDPNFFQTVTCLCEHTPEGAVGIIVNRAHPSLCGKDIFDELRMEYMSESALVPVYLGGPVHIGEIFILHGPPFHWAGCLKVTDMLALSNTTDILEALALGKGPKSAIITIGCAGWGPEQLETEIRENVWLTGPVYEEIIFDISIEARWEASVRKIGVNPVLLTDMAGHA